MSHHLISRETQKNTENRKRLDKIIKFLAANRGPHSIHNIRSRLRIDLQSPENLAVKDALQMNEKVNAMGNTFEYKPRTPNIHDKRDLQQYLQNKPEGVDYDELRDAYVAADRDLGEWRKTGRVIDFMNADSKKHILFWYFGRLRVHPMDTEKDKNAQKRSKDKEEKEDDAKEKDKRITMDVPEEIEDRAVDKQVFPLIGDSIISTWNDIRPPPTKDDLQHELEKVNLISGGFTKKRTRKKNAGAGGKQRKRRNVTTSRLNLTNTHMLQNASLKKTMIAQNEKQSGGKERELPQIPDPQ